VGKLAVITHIGKVTGRKQRRYKNRRVAAGATERMKGAGWSKEG
jgi:hypothetical protein